MNNTAEYERIFNMSINDRRQLLKDKDQDFKKEYFAYDNRERARIRRQTKKTDEDNKDTKNVSPTIISQDPLLNTNPELFKQKIDEMFKNAKINAQNSNSNIDIVNEVINNTPKTEPVIKEQPINPAPIITATPAPAPSIINLPTIQEKMGDETIYHDTIYANTIISKSYITDDGEEGYVNDGDISNIKNYNIKIPVEHLSDIYIKMPNNNNSSLIIDGEYCYVFFK